MLNQLARYGAVMESLASHDGGTLLEVGSGSEGIARFSGDRWNITICDRDFSDYGSTSLDAPSDGLERVEGDVLDLPFADRQFEFVVALDLLEHVPSGQRKQALSELARVTNRRLIAGCPCGERALRGDRRLSRYYSLMPKAKPTWLAEHLENGFPEPKDLEAALAEFGEVTLRPNENCFAHEMVSMAEATPLVLRATLRLARWLEPALTNTDRARFNWHRRVLALLRGGDRMPAYRHIAILDR